MSGDFFMISSNKLIFDLGVVLVLARMKFVIIFGPPAVGKMTVGMELKTHRFEALPQS